MQKVDTYHIRDLHHVDVHVSHTLSPAVLHDILVATFIFGTDFAVENVGTVFGEVLGSVVDQVSVHVIRGWSVARAVSTLFTWVIQL